MDYSIADFWADELDVLPASAIANTTLSAETKQFLQTIGLPLKAGQLTSLVKEALFIQFYTNPNGIYALTYNDQSFIVIAQEPIIPNYLYCIRDLTGEVLFGYIEDLELSNSKCFINSNIKSFLSFLTIYLKDHLLPISKKGVEEEPELVAELLRKKFIEIDPVALDDENKYWSVILEQVEIGLI